MSEVTAAIAQLQSSLEVVRNNEPIWREEGNESQADLCRRNGESYEAAIEVLSASS